MYYWVNFEDGSRSRDTYPEHILNYDCLKFGPPPKGAAVQVLWTDGERYAGHFQGYEQREDAYKLQFIHPVGQPKVIRVERSDFYLADENLPSIVRDNLAQRHNPIPPTYS